MYSVLVFVSVTGTMIFRYYPLSNANIIGTYTLLDTRCSATSLAAALLANSPAYLLAAAINASAAAQALQQAAMVARLTAVQPLLAALQAEPQPSLRIVGMDPATQLVWMGIQNVICFVLPPSINSNPKGLVLYVGDGSSGEYYPDALGDGDLPMTNSSQGCSNFTVSPGVAVGPYTISLEDLTLWRPFVTIALNVDAASLSESSFVLYSETAGAVTLSWGIPADRASATDAVWALNSKGAVVYWFYTSCKCQTARGPTATNGTYSLRLARPAVPGGYSFELHPRNGSAAAAQAVDWIPWASIGW